MSLPTQPAPESKNSVFDKVQCQVIAEIPLLPIRSQGKSQPTFDIVDETLYHFRTNIFMRDFKIKSGADRLMIYLTFFAMRCLKMFAQKKTKDAAKTELESWNLKADFAVPGDSSFILASLVKEPATPADKASLKNYFKVARQETGRRLFEIVFKDGTADKWWICFANRKFMDKVLTN